MTEAQNADNVMNICNLMNSWDYVERYAYWNSERDPSKIYKNGAVHDFTDVEAADPQFANLILKSGNAYTFAQDGYGAYFSANLSVTKEIGDSVSLSFFANNFTNSRMSVTSLANGVSAVFTPAFYYGLTCRIKF